MVLAARYADQVINLCLDTIEREKQALVFCNTKRGAESQAEKVSTKTRLSDSQKRACLLLAKEVVGVLETPTKQCRRLEKCVSGGVAFHHAGLHYKQRSLIEEAFRDGVLAIICSTPTLAMGLDLPAFRSIIRDVKRFNPGRGWGMAYIPVLEYEQMCGRAGRPGKESFGEAILVASDAGQAQELRERYLEGEPEEIYSKLAVEPVLRTYLLSLVATGFVKDRESMYSFFDETFYAKQYGDTGQLHTLLDKMLRLLVEWAFVTVEGGDLAEARDDFSSAGSLMKERSCEERFEATLVGARVAELYLDPYTAHFLIDHLKEAETLRDAGLLHLLANTLEIRPLLRPRAKEYPLIDEWLVAHDGELLVPEPTQYSHEYDEFLASVKTAMLLLSWVEESSEDALFERFGARPGELRAKTDISDWLLYACEELCKLLSLRPLLSPLSRMRTRLKHGVLEELLPLLRFKGVGKVRARALYNAGLVSIGAVKEADASTLVRILGPALTKNVKSQLGQEVDPEKLAVPRRKRKGQKSLEDWG